MKTGEVRKLGFNKHSYLGRGDGLSFLSSKGEEGSRRMPLIFISCSRWIGDNIWVDFTLFIQRNLKLIFYEII